MICIKNRLSINDYYNTLNYDNCTIKDYVRNINKMRYFNNQLILQDTIRFSDRYNSIDFKTIINNNLKSHIAI